MSNDDSEVLTGDEGPIRVITLNRPHRLNAFTADGYRALADALRDADDEPNVHVVLVEGAGRAFSSGVDLDAFRGGDRQAYVTEFGSLLATLLGLRKPLVAAVSLASLLGRVAGRPVARSGAGWIVTGPPGLQRSTRRPLDF